MSSLLSLRSLTVDHSYSFSVLRILISLMDIHAARRKPYVSHDQKDSMLHCSKRFSLLRKCHWVLSLNITNLPLMRITRRPALISKEEYYHLLVVYLSFCFNLVGLRCDSFLLWFFFSFAYFHENGLDKNWTIQNRFAFTSLCCFSFKSVYI